MKAVCKYIVFMATLVVVMSFTMKPTSSKIVFSIRHYVGDSLLQLDHMSYKNGLQQPFTVSKLRYYIGNFTLQKTDGAEVIFAGYYLVDEEDAASKIMSIDIPQGEYTGVKFTMGVDSADNCSGPQTGALDPVHAMFWAWNTGYIFMKLEGNAPLSTEPGHLLQYHIGGYRKPYSCIRQVSLRFYKPFLATGDASQQIAIKADISKIFSGSTVVDFASLPSVTDFHRATDIADNYAQMFSIIADR
jgi:hypothetical protein